MRWPTASVDAPPGPRPGLLPALGLAAVVHGLLLFAFGLPEPDRRTRTLTVTLSVAPTTAASPAETRAENDQSGRDRQSRRPAAQSAGHDQADSEGPDRTAGRGQERATPVLTRSAPGAGTAAATGRIQQGGAALAGQNEPGETSDPKVRTARADARASYLATWKQRIEARGSARFPPEARHRRDAALTMEVWLAPDGRLRDARIRHSSDDPALDAAALEILEAAGPFEPPPAATAGQQQEGLRFAYVWRFLAPADAE
ncbi:TonB family protein [Spectribacter hydrogenoxidans]|uniref:TonB family protein n=1 Tax=Spectribacter hydrogenoxidans TaxID=3075608 RepID=A0ABU3BY09_9GAMM|nr:TonB family protein [Salinisphaera sp. W335]MDT0634192.1 TonB family protein [Salinisphaera sp. W335]